MYLIVFLVICDSNGFSGVLDCWTKHNIWELELWELVFDIFKYLLIYDSPND